MDQAATDTSANLAHALVRFQCVLSGLYLWEYIASIGHDWQHISGKRPRRWTTWVYLGCRISTLASMVLLFVAANVTQQVNCRVLIAFINIFSYLAFQLAVLLVVLRIAVVWNHNIFVVTISLVAWLVNVAVFIWSTVTAPITWQPNLHTCIIIYKDSLRDTEITTLCTDVFLVLLMLAGLVRKQRAETEAVWNVLYRQGLIWLTLAIVAEVPAVALTSAHVSAISNPKNSHHELLECIVRYQSILIGIQVSSQPRLRP
ncbi:hypothetical protein OF83DRAFT_1168369 [Amylostereum chailletii]|nr:hypothetical protein OF83DRAFT_1168369 [Amylostereum chailletii]